MKTSGERRQLRRAQFDAAIEIRSRASQEVAANADPIIGQVKNVSLAGAFCHIEAPCSLTAGEQVTCSVCVPPEQTRSFPFTRILGKG